MDFRTIDVYTLCSSRDTRKYYALTRLKSYVHCEAPKNLFYNRQSGINKIVIIVKWMKILIFIIHYVDQIKNRNENTNKDSIVKDFAHKMKWKCKNISKNGGALEILPKKY